MIEVRIREVCESRGIDTAYRLQVEAGFTPTLASSLFNQTFKQLSLTTLNRLCVVLDCGPGHLLRFERHEKDEKGRLLGKEGSWRLGSRR